jgi:hypothetical protein
MATGIRQQQQRAAHFWKLSRERHRKAAELARQALAAQKRGRAVEARRIMDRALQVKAAAGRAALRSRLHRERAEELKRARRRARSQDPANQPALPSRGGSRAAGARRAKPARR